MEQFDDKSNSSLIDAKDRELITTEFTKNIFVDAGAGSGKTTAMVARIIETLRRGLAPIEKIVAITFTNEGAASLKIKIRENLEEAISHETESNEIKNRLQSALENLRLARISTIHSFCADILRERPIEAGLDPAFEISEANISEINVSESWMRFLLSSQEGWIQEFLISEKIDFEQVIEMIKAKLNYPDLDIYRERVTDPDEKYAKDLFDQHFRNLEESIKAFQSELEIGINNATGQKRKEYVVDLIKSINNVMYRDSNYKGFILGINESKTKPAWTNKQPNMRLLYDNFMSPCRQYKKQYEDYLHHQLSSIIAKYEEFSLREKMRDSKLDFEDLLYLTCKLLKSHPEVRSYYKKKFDYLFIDETQDTDPMQTEIVFFLCEEENRFENEWTQVKLKPGKLFMVGDPKQSIYRFRRADIQIYNKAKDLIAQQGGSLLKLTTNFRSSSKILDFVNDHFEATFRGQNPLQNVIFQPVYEPLTPSPEKIESDINPIFVNMNNSDDEIKGEARKSAKFIKDLVDVGKYSYKDFTILFRSYSNVSAYSEIFEKSGIPFYEVGEKQYFQIEEVRALVSFLEAIDDSNNIIALYSLLKSPVFGFSDKNIFDYVGSGKRLSIYSANENSNELLDKALMILKDLANRKNNNLPSQLLKLLLDKTGTAHVPLTSKYGLQAAAKIFRLIEMLQEFETDHSLTFSGIIRNLKKTMESDTVRLASLHLSKAGSDAIRMMTIHKSKGLEAPVIILADAFKDNSKSNLRNTAYFYEQNNQRSIILPYNSGGFYSLDIESIKSDEQQKNDCEEERLRYVAATRAMDLLMICVRENENNDDGKSKSISYFLKNFKNSMIGNDEEPLAHIKEITGSIEEVDIYSHDSGNDNLEKTFDEAIKNRDIKLSQFSESKNKLRPMFRSVHDLLEIREEDYWIGGRVSRGKAFGSLIHKLMELHVNQGNFNLENIIDRLMGEYEVSPKHREDVKTVYNKLILNQHLVEAKKSPEKYCEWEFIRKLDDGTFLTGTIDLIYKTVDGNWVILDYKTDDLADENYKKQIEPNYKKQLEFYKQSFEESTGFRISHCLLIYPD